MASVVDSVLNLSLQRYHFDIVHNIIAITITIASATFTELFVIMENAAKPQRYMQFKA